MRGERGDCILGVGSCVQTRRRKAGSNRKRPTPPNDLKAMAHFRTKTVQDLIAEVLRTFLNAIEPSHSVRRDCQAIVCIFIVVSSLYVDYCS